VALVTGASGGIGLALARQLAARGYDLVLVARSHEKLQTLALDIAQASGQRVEVFVHDLQDPEAPGRLHQEFDGLGLPLDLLVNNAGYGVVGTFHDVALKEQLGMIDLNVRALSELTHLFLPQLVKRSGGILNVCSISAFLPMPLMSVYGASKAFVLTFSKMLHDEVGPLGVDVTAVCPGYTPTGFLQRAGMGEVAVPGWVPGHSPEKVAEVALVAHDKGRRVVVVGAANRITVFLARLLGPMMRMAAKELNRRLKTGSQA
jgi:short-subunit dehydrogenase